MGPGVGEDGDVVGVGEYSCVWMCWDWYVVHEEFEKGWSEYRPLWRSIGEACVCEWSTVVDGVGVSTCKEGRQPLLVVCVNVCSVYS